MFSKSTKCRVILGLIAAKYLKGTVIDYIDTIIISALKELVDEEIELFKQIYAEDDGEDVVRELCWKRKC
ncbi:MAG: hypothetical protein LBN07_03540 [Christensenellaceae bacterium]|jgi:hypothetical protein|nr:hypothetical protein [Christensenellaceae bacterium]